jgi:hypothetical protein
MIGLHRHCQAVHICVCLCIYIYIQPPARHKSIILFLVSLGFHYQLLLCTYISTHCAVYPSYPSQLPAAGIVRASGKLPDNQQVLYTSTDSIAALTPAMDINYDYEKKGASSNKNTIEDGALSANTIDALIAVDSSHEIQLRTMSWQKAAWLLCGDQVGQF